MCKREYLSMWERILVYVRENTCLCERVYLSMWERILVYVREFDWNGRQFDWKGSSTEFSVPDWLTHEEEGFGVDVANAHLPYQYETEWHDKMDSLITFCILQILRRHCQKCCIKDDSHTRGLFLTLTLTMKCAGSSDLDQVHQGAAAALCQELVLMPAKWWRNPDIKFCSISVDGLQSQGRGEFNVTH